MASTLLSAPNGYTRSNLILLAEENSKLQEEHDINPDALPNWKNIENSIGEQIEKAGSNDLLLFFFSGHGLSVGNQRSYLVCKDTDPAHLQKTAVAMSDIKVAFQHSDAKIGLIFLDTCHSGAIFDEEIKNASPMTHDYIQKVHELAEGLFIITSCGPEQYSYPYIENSMGAFSYFLVKGLKEALLDNFEFVTVQSLGNYLRREVSLWAITKGKQQIPHYENQKMVGDPIIIDWRGGQNNE